MSNWFDVDKEGLRQLVAGRSKGFVIAELVSNCWDEEGVTRVDVILERATPRTWRVRVIDDSPTGFSDLRDTFTLYKPSAKKMKAMLRGRFNLGEKLVLALCSEAEIRTMSGGVRFGPKGRHAIHAKRERGSEFCGTMVMTLEEVAQMEAIFRRLLPPKGCETSFRAEGGASFVATTREPVQAINAYLPTVLADETGVLRDSWRIGSVELHEPLPGEKAWAYELGIPVVELDGDRWSCNVLQKVPLTKERDATTGSFLSSLRSCVLNARVAALTDEEASASWVTNAAEGWQAEKSTVAAVVAKRFGEKRVAYDPSDLEANMTATSKGYTVVHGGAMSGTLWSRAKDAGAIQPAGQVFPTQHTHESPDGIPEIAEDQRTEGHRVFIAFARDVCEALMQKPVRVRLFSHRGLRFRANYNPRTEAVSFNIVGGEDFGPFERGDVEPVLSTILHELAHAAESNHLSEKFHDEIGRLGARLAVLAAARPRLVDACAVVF